MTKKNGCIILTGLTTLCLALAFGVMPKSVDANAETTATTKHNEILGASIRVDGSKEEGTQTTATGIRFGYVLDVETAGIQFASGSPSNIYDLGMKVTVNGTEKDVPFYVDGVASKGDDGVERKINRVTLDGNGGFQLDAEGNTVLCMIYFYNFQDVDDYVMDITVQGYAQIGAEGTPMSSTAETRSIAQVARSARDAKEDIDVDLLETYFVVKATEEIELFDATAGMAKEYDQSTSATVEKTLAAAFEVELPTITSATAESVVSEGEPVMTALTVEGNAVKNVPVDNEKVVKQTITLQAEDGKIDYKVTVNPYTAVIGSFDDLQATFPDTTGTGSSTTTRETKTGYYILSQNIECNSTQPKKKQYYYFDGVFDGNGYSINQLKCRAWGLLGNITGTVKNVAFTNTVAFDGNTTPTALGNLNENAKLENVYIGYAANTTSYDDTKNTFNVFGGSTYKASMQMDNVVIDISKVTIGNLWNVCIFAKDGVDLYNAELVPAEGENPATVTVSIVERYQNTINENVKNVYIIGTAPMMYQAFTPTKSDNPTKDIERLYILDAGNRKNDETLGYLNPTQAETPRGILYMDGVQRFDTADQYVEATKGGVDSSFGSLWAVDETNGLVWVGKQA